MKSIQISKRKKRKLQDRERERGRKEECVVISTYPDPGAVEVGLIEAGDDLLDEVAGGAESAALAEEEGGGLGVVQGGADVQDGLQVTVYPIIPGHRSQQRRRRREREGVGDEEDDRRRRC